MSQLLFLSHQSCSYKYINGGSKVSTCEIVLFYITIMTHKMSCTL